MQGTRLNLGDTEVIYLMRLLQETEHARPEILRPWNPMFHVKLRKSLELYAEEITRHGTSWRETNQARAARREATDGVEPDRSPTG